MHDHDDEHQAARPTEDRSGPLTIRTTVAAGEALSDGLYAPPEDLWPDAWIGHQEAHSAALAAVARALDGDAGPDALELLERAQGLLDHALHAELTRAAETAAHVAIVDRLHLAGDGSCWIAQRADPLAVEPGGYRRDRVPRYLTEAQGGRWLASGPKRKRCRRCYPGR